MPRTPSARALLQGLNPEQRVAVETTEGPLLVLAGAGSGKTKVVTHRIAHLLAKRVAPERILAVTFTNKAAGEMRERVAALVGKTPAGRLTVGTFHAFCLSLLREHAGKLGYGSGFTICDASDQIATAKAVLRELRVAEAQIAPPALQARISLSKSRGLTPETLLASPGSDVDELVGRAWRRYEEVLRRSRRLDFDDLLSRGLELLEHDDEVGPAVRERFRYVMVDEYQDTNDPQYRIVQAISREHGNLCVVGDDDQSIYGWRGADVKKILSFERDFAGARVVRLETNYRSTVEILTAANRLIANNPGRHEKEMRSAKGRGELVRLLVAREEDAEAESVVLEILEGTRRGHNRFADYAILFRTAQQPRPFEAELRARGVPYVLVGGMSFFDRKEVRDVLAYLRLVANPADEASLLRVVNCPPRGVGKTTLERVLAFATEHGIGAPEAFDRGSEIPNASPAAVETVQRLRARLAALGERFGGRQLVDLVGRLLEEVSYRTEVDRCHREPREAESRWASVSEIMDFAESHVRRSKNPSLLGFLNELSLSAEDRADEDETGKRDAVTLMTLHSSKGLEFPRVYLVGLEEGLLPHARSVAEDTIEEERRLAYVGLTRAREALTLSHCLERSRFGRRAPVHPSRFLFEVKGEAPPEGWVAGGAPLDVRTTKGRGRKKRTTRRKRAPQPGSSPRTRR